MTITPNIVALQFAMRWWPRSHSKDIALIGNGLVNPRAAASIEQHRFVVRFNACNNFGASGAKTDALVLINTGAPAKDLLHNKGLIPLPALDATKSFWFPRSVTLIDQLQVENKINPNNDIHAWTDFTEELLQNFSRGKPSMIFDKSTWRNAETELKKFGMQEFQQPSTGIQTLFHIRDNFESPKVTLYGFSHLGWEGHPWEAERMLVDSWSGWVKRFK